MKVVYIVLILILLFYPVVADNPGENYRNMTKSLLTLNDRIIQELAPLVFTEEEMKELNGLFNANELLAIQEELLLSSDLEKMDNDFNNEEGRVLSSMLNTSQHYQKVVLLDDYCGGFNILLNKINTFI